MNQNANEKYRDVFLSHNSENKEFVRGVAADIEDNIYEGKNLLTWLDEAEIKPGQSITKLVNEGLENSRFFAIVMTPEYFESNSGWTDAEWHSALYSDPDNRQGKIIPILAADCPYLPPLLKHLRYVDLREKNYEQGLKELIASLTNKPLPRPKRVRGQIVNSDGKLNPATLMAERAIPQSEPDAINERLFLNLFPILSLPEYIYFGKIKQEYCPQRKDGSYSYPSKKYLKEAIREYQTAVQAENPFMPTFRLYEGNIVSFHNLDLHTSWLKHFVEEGSISTERTTDLLDQEDSYKIAVSLLNMSISRHMYRQGLIVDYEKSSRFFFPTDNGQPNIIEYQSFKNKGKRTVAKPIEKNERIKFWLHQGVFLKIVQFGNRLYLQLNPTWVLTKDGHTPLGGKDVAKTINKWQNAERNASVLRHNKFWSSVLSAGYNSIHISTGDQIMKVDPNPCFVDMHVGITHDQTDSFKDMDADETTVEDIIDGNLSEGFDGYYGNFDEDIIDEDDEDLIFDLDDEIEKDDE
ncbi:MAG: toll/interleukin-1 receptor domain-containing protein [Flavobacteriales bacterium]